MKNYWTWDKQIRYTRGLTRSTQKIPLKCKEASRATLILNADGWKCQSACVSSCYRYSLDGAIIWCWTHIPLHSRAVISNSHGSAVKVFDFHLANLSSSPEVTNMSYWWRAERNSDKITRVHQELVSWLVLNDTFSTNRLYRATGVWNISRRSGEQHRHIAKQWNDTLNQENHRHSSAWALWRRSPCHS